MVSLSHAIPALPVRELAAAADFYRDRVGFDVVHQDEGFAVLSRDEAVVHVWRAGDESWRERRSLEQPVRSGAESFIAGTTSCRVLVDGVDELDEELRGNGVLHQVSRNGVSETDFGTRQFATLDQDGNLLIFFQWESA